MKYWQPCPADLILTDCTQRWTRENPAPSTLGYLWAWQHLDACGRAPSRRDLMRAMGWTSHRARTMIERVRSEHSAWASNVKKRQKTPSHRPPKQSNDEGLQGRTAQPSPIARAFSHYNPQDPTLCVSGSATALESTPTPHPPILDLIECNPHTPKRSDGFREHDPRGAAAVRP